MRADRSAFGRMTRMLLASILALAGSAAQAESFALAEVMAKFAASRGVEAEFREEKRLPLLSRPLVSEGVFYFARPDRMVRFTHDPDPSSLLLVGNRLRIEDSLGVEEIDLGVEPTAQKLVTQLLVLLRGDLIALQRDYQVDLKGTAKRWTLELETRGARARAVIHGLTLVGEAGRLDSMTLRGANGEVTRTRYRRVVTDRVFSEQELTRLFPEHGSPQPLVAATPIPEP